MSWFIRTPDSVSLRRQNGPGSGFELADISSTDHTFSRPVRAISFATAGDIAIITPDGTDDVIPSGVLAAGVMHPVEAVTIKKTGTTAETIVGYW